VRKRSRQDRACAPARLVLAEQLSWSQSAGVVMALLGVGLLATG